MICAPVLSTDIMKLDGVGLPWQGWLMAIAGAFAYPDSDPHNLKSVDFSRCAVLFSSTAVRWELLLEYPV